MSKNILVNITHRQYTGQKNLSEYDRIIKKLWCQKVNTFVDNVSDMPNDDTQYMGVDYDVPVYTCKFCPTDAFSHIVAIANENGTVSLENLKTNAQPTYIPTHNNTIFDLNWMPYEHKFVTVSGDHTAKLWDVSQDGSVKLLSEFIGHLRSVKCLSFKPQNTCVFATGSRDGSIILWDCRSATKCMRIPETHRPDQRILSAAGTSPVVTKRRYLTWESAKIYSITGLAFQDDNSLIASSCSEKTIRVWDMRKTYSARFSALPTPRHQLSAPSPGFSNLCIDPTGTKLYASCMDSYIYCFNINSHDPSPIAAFYGHHNGTFYVKASVSRDGRYLMSGSTNKLAYIWNTAGAEQSATATGPIAALPGHNAEVTCVDMSHSARSQVITCSDDGTYRIWGHYGFKGEGETCSEIGPENLFTQGLEKHSWRNSRLCREETEHASSASKRGKDECDLKIYRFFKSPTGFVKISSDDDEPVTGKVTEVKAATKRKLADMPEFAVKKRVACRRPILSPVKEHLEGNGLEGIGAMEERHRSLLGRLTDPGSDRGGEGSASSPTVNLPNYVIDGSSPYGHKCQRSAQHKENIDWLTKLRKEKCKYATIGTPEEKKTTSRSGTPSSADKAGAARSASKRSLARSRSVDDEKQGENTLLQYFKVSVKP